MGGSSGFSKLWGPKLAAAPQPLTPAGSGAAPALGRGCRSEGGRSRRGLRVREGCSPQPRVGLMKPVRPQALCTYFGTWCLHRCCRTPVPPGTSSRADLRDNLQPMPPALSRPPPPLDLLPISRQLLLPSPPLHPFWHLLLALAPFLWFPLHSSLLAGRTDGGLAAWVLSTRRMRSVGCGCGCGAGKGRVGGRR